MLRKSIRLQPFHVEGQELQEMDRVTNNLMQILNLFPPTMAVLTDQWSVKIPIAHKS